MNIWILLLITLILSAFFSGLEIAFITSNKLKIELDKKRGLLNAKILSGFISDPSKFISTMLVGNAISLVIYGMVSAIIIESLIKIIIPDYFISSFYLLIIQTLFSTIVIITLAEFFPKLLFKINSNYVLKLLAIPAYFFYYLLFPIVIIFTGISKFILVNILKIKINKTARIFNFGDLQTYINEYKSEQDEEEKEINRDIQLFQNAMEMRNIKIRECLIPRTEIIAIDEEDDIQNLKKKFIESGFSKILVYKENIDNITGYVHSGDIFKDPSDIKSVKRNILYVPESMMANKLLTFLIQQRKSIAVVVDEFGGTAGILTVEDLIEEIFGEINDEYDTDELTDKKINENEYVFSGRLEIDYINEKYSLNIPESNEYETLAGFIIQKFQNIPKINDEIQIDPFLFIILQSTENKILQVKVKLLNNN
ncbi:MAG: HlyC/CorC family transporter [Bacteroidales bacterium]|nr:HlyC/CorC family transporter [Bacteroidales bacterium]